MVGSPPVVELRDASRTYAMNGSEVTALRGVTLTVEPRDFLAVVGPSGSGKSTLLHLMGGVDLPTSGHVVLFGQQTDTLSDATISALRLRHVGFIFQRFFLLPMLTVEENVALPMLEAGLAVGTREQRVGELLDYVGLAQRRHHLPGQLSGGELQRAAIARALANRPSLVLADEPTGELDQETGRQIGALLQRIHGEGTAVVVVTHNTELAGLAKQILFLRDGRIA